MHEDCSHSNTRTNRSLVVLAVDIRRKISLNKADRGRHVQPLCQITVLTNGAFDCIQNDVILSFNRESS